MNDWKTTTNQLYFKDNSNLEHWHYDIITD